MDVDYRTCPNLVKLFFDQAERLRDKPFLWAKHNDAWKALTWAESADQVRRLARGLIELGLKSGDRIGLVSENRPEWVIADLAIRAAGGITAPAYTTNTVDDHRHIFTNAGTRGVIASTRALAERAALAARQVPGCEFVIAIEMPGFMQHIGVTVV